MASTNQTKTGSALVKRSGGNSHKAPEAKKSEREEVKKMNVIARNDPDAIAYPAQGVTRDMMEYKGRIKQLLAKEVKSCEDAATLPDEISIAYTFNFPEAEEEFISFFQGDLEVFSTNVFDRSNKKTQVSTRGLSNYTLRCPFLACAFCIRLDIDSYLYTIPGIVSDKSTTRTPATDGAVEAVASNPFAAGQRNATFDHGNVSNMIAYFLYNYFGIRIELGCNDVVRDQRLSYAGFEMGSRLGICANTNVDVTFDVRDFNRQADRVDNDSDLTGKQFTIPNANGCGCQGNSGAPQLSSSPITAASSGDYEYFGKFGGCIPLPKVPLMAGMGLEAVLYTLPGNEDKRDQMLEMVRSGLINPSLDNPDVRVQQYVVTWNGGTGQTPTILNIVGPCGNVTEIAAGDQIPRELVEFVVNEDGTVSVFARWGHAWTGTTYVASTTTPVGATGPFLRRGLEGSVEIPATSLDVESLDVSIGSAEQYLIRHGKLVITFAIKGAYMSWDELVEYICSLCRMGGTNAKVARRYTAQMEVMQAILNAGAQEGLKVFSQGEQAGVGSVEDIRRFIDNKVKEASEVVPAPEKGGLV